MAEHGRGAARPDRQGGIGALELRAAHAFGQQRADGLLDEGSTVLTAHHESGLDLAALDASGDEGHGVGEAEAGVGEVEGLGGGEFELRVDHRCGRRLHEVATDGGVDDAADAIARDPGARASASSPAMTDASLGRVPAGQKRRSRIPLTPRRLQPADARGAPRRS